MSLAIFQILERRGDNVTLRERKRFVENYTKDIQTSVHSSRMFTTRLLTTPHSILEGVSAQGSGVSAWGGVCLGRGVSALLHAGIHPSVNRIPDRCKNITLPQTSFAGGNKCKTAVLKIQ